MGGLITAFLGIFQLLSFQLSEVLLISSILDSLFFIKKDPSTEQEKSERVNFRTKSKVFHRMDSFRKHTTRAMNTERETPPTEETPQLELNHQSSETKDINDFKMLKKNLANRSVDQNDIRNIIDTIFFKRVRFSRIFSYPLLILISYFGWVAFCKNKISKATKRKIKIFKNGERKFLRELDVVNLLESVRTSNFLAN